MMIFSPNSVILSAFINQDSSIRKNFPHILFGYSEIQFTQEWQDILLLFLFIKKSSQNNELGALETTHDDQ